MLRQIAVAACSLALATGTAVAVAAPAEAAAKTYKNCTELNKTYKHGVGKSGAKDKTSGTPVKNFTKNSAVYAKNTKSDRDKDGIACEKK